MAGDWQVTQRLLRAGMDTMLLKQRVVAENIANVNTPGYKRRDVTFPAILRQAERRLPLRTTHPQHLPRPTAPGSPQVVVDTATTMRNDLNNVDLDREMASLAQAQILYNALVEQFNRGYQRLRTAVREGRA